MEFQKIDQFLAYFEKVRARTMRIVDCIPEDKIEWTYKEGKFTLGDLCRHLATIERHMYAENAQFKFSDYPGCGIEFANGKDAVVSFMQKMHEESMQIFRTVSDEQLFEKCQTPAGIEITLWKWLRLMAEHEIHHRGQIYLYLSMLGVDTPPLYGLTAEEVQEKSGN